MMLSSLRMNKYQTHLRRIRKARFYSGGGDLRSLGRHKSTHGDFFNVKIDLYFFHTCLTRTELIYAYICLILFVYPVVMYRVHLDVMIDTAIRFIPAVFKRLLS